MLSQEEACGLLSGGKNPHPPLDSSNTTPVERRRETSLLPGGRWSLGFPRGLHWHCMGTDVTAAQLEWVLFLWHYVSMVLVAWQGWTSKASNSAFVGMNGREPQFFPWCLAAEEELVSKSVLSCEAAHFLIIWLERAGLPWDFFFAHAWWYLDCWLLQLKSDVFEAKQTNKQTNKKQRNSLHCCSLHFKISSWAALFTPSFRVLIHRLLLFFKYNVQGF